MEFDPYREWLSIPAGSRPPNYYELLGLPAGESDAARIESAALERSANVRRYQMGGRSEAALRVVAELSEAFACLSDPTRKQQYDRQLQGRATVADAPSPGETLSDAPPVQSPRGTTTSRDTSRLETAPPLRQTSAVPKPPAAATAKPAAPAEDEYGKTKKGVPARSLSRQQLALAATAAMATLLVVAIVAWSMSGRGKADGDATAVASAPGAAGSTSTPTSSPTPKPAPPPPSATPTSPPTVRIADAGASPHLNAGPTLTVRLDGQSNAPGGLNYEYRIEPDGQWRRAAGPTIVLPDLKVGSLAVAFRAVDAHGQVSAEVREQWQIAEPPSSPPNTVASSPPQPPSKPSSKTSSKTPTPPKPSEPNRPPTLVDAKLSTDRALAGEVVTVTLQGTDPDTTKGLRYEYRLGNNQPWLAAPRAQFALADMPAGSLLLHFRCLDDQSLPSESLVRELTIEPNAWAAWDQIQRLDGHTAPVTSVALRSTTGFVSGSEDGTARVWRLSDGQYQRTLNSTQGAISQLFVSRDGTSLASLSQQGSIDCWLLNKGTFVRTINPRGIGPNGFGLGFGGMPTFFGSLTGVAALTQDASIAVFATHQSTLQWFQVQTNGTMKNGPALQYTDSAVSMAISRDGKSLAVGARDGSLVVYKMADGKLLHDLLGHNQSPQALAFSLDNDELASGDAEGNVFVWSMRTGERRLSLRGDSSGIHCLSYGPGNLGALVGGDGNGQVRIWRTSDGHSMRTLTGHTGIVRCLTFGPSGTMLISGGADNTVRLWGPPAGSKK